MKKVYIFLITVLLFISFTFQDKSIAQDSTFAFKLNGHKYNQPDDLMIRGIQEWFVVAMDSLDIPALIDTLAVASELEINELTIPKAVQVFYEVDASETYDFLINITIDTMSISAFGPTGFDCNFEVDIIGAGIIIRGVSNYENGELKIELGAPNTLKPEISVVGTGYTWCPGLADIFKTQIEGEIDSLLLSLASMYESESFDDLLTFLNPIQAMGIEDSALIEQALESFPMDMDMYAEEDPDREIVQLIIEINFLMGTTDNPSIFIDIPVPDITESQLEKGGFSFLYWVLQQSFPWHDWTESKRVNEAFNIMEEVGLKNYRIEMHWSELQKLAYHGNELDPADISPENIDGLLADTDYWDTTAFLDVQEYLNNGFTRELEPFMALGVGHEDRLPLFDEIGSRIAPATEEWDPAEGYTGVSANEYLYNLKIYAHATVRQFADKIKVWQIENELNAAGFAAAVPEWWRKGDLWSDTDFINDVWDILVNAVRTEDPDNTTMIIHDFHMLGFMQGLEEWIDDVDIVGINYYPNQLVSLPVMGFTVGEYVWAVRRALIGLKQEGKPVWLTETGYPGIMIEDPPDSIKLIDDFVFFSEGRQEEYIETALQSAVDNGVSGFFYYSLVTQDDFPGGIPEPMRFSGMVRRETDIYKPALQTYADLYEKFLISDPTATNDESLIVPEKASLHQNYPNPFNPTTIINYELRITNYVDLSIYNLLGQKVTVLVSERQSAGRYQVEWDATQFAGGIYFYRLKAGSFSDIKKMVLIK
jgi:hypothetical protein